MREEVSLSLFDRIDAALSEPVIESASVGLLARSLEDGRVVFSFNPWKLFIPTSTVQLLSTAAALDSLGGHYRFRTALCAFPHQVRDGTLVGGLYLRGYGDPSLDRAGIDRLAAAVAKAGIKRIEGPLFVDNSFFDSEPLGRGWTLDREDDPCYAHVDALTYHENVAEVVIVPGDAPGQPVRVHGEPEGHPFRFRVLAKTAAAGTGSSLQVRRLHGRNLMVVSGSLELGAAEVRVRRAVEQPHLFVARAMKRALMRAGVDLSRSWLQSCAVTPPGVRELAIEVSDPLPLLLTVLNRRNQDLYAEQTVKTLGAELRGAGSWEAGLAVVHDFLKRRKVATDGPPIVLVDGSGLSLYNRLAPEHLVRLLEAMHQHPASSLFWNILLKASENGALSARLGRGPLRDSLVGKTGTAPAVSAICGYLRTRSGHLLAVALLTNGFTGDATALHAVEDRILLALWEEA